MRLKLIAVGLLVLNALASLSEAQYQNIPKQNVQGIRPPTTNTKPNQYPAKPNPFPARPNQDQIKPIQDQVKPSLSLRPMTWKFPEVVVPSETGTMVELRTPSTPNSIKIQCEEKQVLVEVDMDFYKHGHLINPADITLGGCAVAGQDVSTNRLLLQSELHSCGAVLTTTDKELIYTFTIIYAPRPLTGTSIIRADGAVVGVACHYQRNHNVSSDVLHPVWVPFSAILTGDEIFLFSLRLMMENFVGIRETTKFYLGDMIYIEASVRQFYHVPLRVYVDNCVASASENPNSVPNYNFIENYGCMTDAKITGSSSRFQQRSVDDKLQFMLEAFKFQDTSMVYITCTLKATAAIVPNDYQHKACSYLRGGGWVAAGGSNEVCSCCDSSCGGGGGGGGVGGGKFNQNQYRPAQGELWGETTIGPIFVSKKKP
ncbi:zona pellucida sperm-binding protein 3-like [Alosa alosa]|uniref:zona pellucida sperm-binding protein 3-like n=1 Tax=Alosa alosa TaxID=278164 RepID=UPI00201545B7|nr:zona pellucida sperm-binding protein 3-like [Alosa alosa]